MLALPTSLLALLIAGASAGASAEQLFRMRMSDLNHPHVAYDVVHHATVTPVGVATHAGDYPHAALAWGVMCGPEPTSVTLFFASKETAVAWNLAAGVEPTLLGFCHVAGSNTRRPVRIRAATVAASGAREHGYALDVVGAPASINDVFRHANVTARLPSDAAAHAAEHRRRLATGGSDGRCDSNDVAAGNCTQAFSGQTVHLPSALNWQMGSKELSYGDVKVKAEGLHVRITPTVYFELAIRINRIEKFSIAIQGSLDAGAGFSFEAAHSVTASNQYDITTVNLPIVSFQIGVFPFVVAPSVPIKAGTFFSANANAKYGATASYSGSVSAGVSMKDGNSLQPRTSITFNQPQSATPAMESSASVQMTAKAWLSAGLNFNVQGLAQLGVRATQTIQAMATIGTEGPANAQVDGKFDVIVDGSLGAKLAGINIPPHLQAGDKTVYSKMFSLWRK